MAAISPVVKTTGMFAVLLHAIGSMTIASRHSVIEEVGLTTGKPGKKPAVRKKKPARKKSRRSSPRIRLWLKRIAIALGVLAVLPVVLTVLYAVPFVHPVSTLMLKDVVTFNGYDRRWVDLENIAPVMIHSVTMSEDGQFCSHHGIDLAALNEVIVDALDGEPVRGASTISMQSVKNLYLWQGRSYVRKVIEAPLAVMFDLVLPKKRVMEIYLNIAEWGPGIYGIEAAARHYFKRSASKLTSRQAALLAVTLPNPHLRNPAKPTKKLNRLASIIQKRVRGATSHIACFD